jgi:hypothetical protein
MRRLIVAMCLGIVGVATASVVRPPFHILHWSADGVLIGRISAQQERTIDVDVEQWFRDRTKERVGRIRVFRDSVGAELPDPLKQYQIGSRYLFLMRKPLDEGAGGNMFWIIILEQQLEGKSICLDRVDSGRVSNTAPICRNSVSEALFIDALHTFDECFELWDDPVEGTFPSNQSCTKERLEEWAGRSAFHALLVKAALDRLERGGGRCGG